MGWSDYYNEYSATDGFEATAGGVERRVEAVMDGRDRENDPHSTEECETAKYESMDVDELDNRLRSAGIDPTRTIDAVRKLVHSKLKEWPK